MQILAFLLALGSTLRLTRLAVTDTITQPFRNAIAMRYAAASALESQSDQNLRDDRGVIAAADVKIVRRFRRRVNAWLWLVQLFECPWCIGFWISLAVAAIALSPAVTSIWIAWPAIALSLSWLVGALAFLEATVEDIHHRLD